MDCPLSIDLFWQQVQKTNSLIFQRNHVTTQPFRVLCIVAFLALIFGIVYIIAKLKSKNDQTIFFHHFVEATLCLVVETYVLLVVESLHKRFRDEKFNHGGFIINRY